MKNGPQIEEIAQVTGGFFSKENRAVLGDAAKSVWGTTKDVARSGEVKSTLDAIGEGLTTAGGAIFKVFGFVDSMNTIRNARKDLKAGTISRWTAYASMAWNAVKGSAQLVGAVATIVGAAVLLPITAAVVGTMAFGNNLIELIKDGQKNASIKKDIKNLEKKCHEKNIHFERDLALFKDLRETKDKINDLKEQRALLQNAIALAKESKAKQALAQDISSNIVSRLSHKMNEKEVLRKNALKIETLKELQEAIVEEMATLDKQSARYKILEKDLAHNIEALEKRLDFEGRVETAKEKLSHLKNEESRILKTFEEKGETLSDQDKQDLEDELNGVQSGITKQTAIITQNSKIIELEQLMAQAQHELDTLDEQFPQDRINAKPELALIKEAKEQYLQQRIEHLQEKIDKRMIPDLIGQKIDELSHDKVHFEQDLAEDLERALTARLASVNDQLTKQEKKFKDTMSWMKAYQIIDPEEHARKIHQKAEKAQKELATLDKEDKSEENQKKIDFCQQLIKQSESLKVLEKAKVVVDEKIESLEHALKMDLEEGRITRESPEHDAALRQIEHVKMQSKGFAEDISRKSKFDEEIESLLKTTSSLIDKKSELQQVKRDAIKHGTNLPLSAAGAGLGIALAVVTIGLIAGAPITAPLMGAMAVIGAVGAAISLGFAAFSKYKQKKAKKTKVETLLENESSLKQQKDDSLGPENKQTLENAQKLKGKTTKQDVIARIRKEIDHVAIRFIPKGHQDSAVCIQELLKEATQNIKASHILDDLTPQQAKALDQYLNSSRLLNDVFDKACAARVEHFSRMIPDKLMQLISPDNGLKWIRFPRARREVIEGMMHDIKSNQGHFENEPLSKKDKKEALNLLKQMYIDAIEEDFRLMDNPEQVNLLQEKLSQDKFYHEVLTKGERQDIQDYAQVQMKAKAGVEVETSPKGQYDEHGTNKELYSEMTSPAFDIVQGMHQSLDTLCSQLKELHQETQGRVDTQTQLDGHKTISTGLDSYREAQEPSLKEQRVHQTQSVQTDQITKKRSKSI